MMTARHPVLDDGSVHAENGFLPSGWGALVSRNNAPRIVVLAGSSLVYALFAFIVVTVLPTAAGEFGGVTYYAWVTTFAFVGSIAGSASTVSLVAWLAPRRAYRLGIALFLAGSVICALAPSMAVLIVGRLLQGLGGGLFTTLASLMIPALFPDGLRSRAIALVSGVWGLAALAGPFLGGLLAEIGLWRGAFWIALPLGLCLVRLADRALPPEVTDDLRSGGAAARPPGLRLAFIAAAALALSAGSVTGALSAAAMGIGTAALLLAAALHLDRRAERRILPSRSFDLRTASGAVATTMGLLVVGVGTAPFIPYVLSVAHGVSPRLGGSIAALSSLSWSLAGLATAAVGRAASRWIIALSPIVTALGLLGVAQALAIGSVFHVAVFWTLFGTGIGMAWPHLAALLIALSPAKERGLAAGFVATLQIGAAAFGAALAGMAANIVRLAAAAAPHDVAHGALWLFAVFALGPVAAVATTARLLTLTGAPVRAAESGAGRERWR